MRNRKQKDVWLYRMFIAALGLTLVASVIGAMTKI
jgi:hypothetical protein